MKRGKLIVVIGATGVGKSAYALELARQLHTEIISADSRQIYKGMQIGTDAPTLSEVTSVPHHFVQCREVWESYSADQYATEALRVVSDLFRTYDTLVMVGGSMMYLQAFLFGFDPIPEVAPQLRDTLWQRFEEEGIAPLRNELRRVDPEYLKKIDPNNHKRIIRALEVYHTSGRPFSSFHSGSTPRTLPFEVELHWITRPREALYERINRRVGVMIQRGLVEEVRGLLPYRSENALNTIGYKEIFEYIDGTRSLEEAGQLIAKHSRTYARQQIAYFKKWCRPGAPFPYRIIELPD
ncbi:MAG: tRNA (adenosine(37)-N6)-dimethylallyltransferase MiaA [Porphyromonas sp.]|nr:tRNA (adenosine(37)-N6)-dimethylallyltransferase MiaA [Porphyromonas sp.]